MNIAIIGGGAAGIFCAGIIGENHSVTLFEKNEKLGKKLLITGHGRCNVTNNKEVDAFLNCVPQNSRFLMSALHGFSPNDMMDYLTNLKVELKTEDNDRVFPKSDKAQTILHALESKLKHVDIKTNSQVLKIEKQASEFIVHCGDGEFVFDKIIIATGGVTYPQTGSTGDGYKFAQNLAHTITSIRPSLCGLVLENNIFNGSEGQSLYCSLTIEKSNKELCTNAGDIMLTSFGVSGPCVLGLVAKLKLDSVKDCNLVLDFLPSVSIAKLKEELDLYILLNSKKQILSVIENFVNAKIAKNIFSQLDLDEDKQCCHLTKSEREKIINALKQNKIRLKDFDDMTRAAVTRGGVNVAEINPKTYESKLCSGLYFIGEVLDIDGLTGGYNLQIAFSTAYACAKAINDAHL